MPYIITTRRDHALGYRLSKDRAVATLDEAFYALPDGLTDTDMARLRFAVEEHGGGTVGPLPDGTIIEVRPISWAEIVEDDDSIARFAVESWNASHD